MEHLKTKAREFCDPSAIRDTVTSNKLRFGVSFVVVLMTTYTFFYAIDFLPEPPQEPYAADTEDTSGQVYSDDETPHPHEGEADVSEVSDDITPRTEVAQDSGISNQNSIAQGESDTINADTTEQDMRSYLPVRMHIDALDRDISILNPTSRTISDLDAALKHGAVRHPDAANLQQEGNIFILGHSSYLPNVMNRNYQLFNGIENLQWGDVIRVFSDNREYIYRVDRVYEARASALVIPIADTGSRLTLATCDSFGSIDDRFIVEAELQNSRPVY